MQIFQNIADLLFISPSQRRTTEVTQIFIRLCVRFGHTVNLDKPLLKASQSLFRLAVQWDFFARRCVRRH